jgi:hypothetical protein
MGTDVKKNFKKYEKSIIYIYENIMGSLNAELSEYLSDPEIVPIAFHIDFKKEMTGSEEVSCVLSNGTMGSRLVNLNRNNSSVLNYALRIGPEEDAAARGLLKIKIIEKGKKLPYAK